MSQETRTFHIDGSDYSFNFSAFGRFFKSYRAGTKRNITETEQAIADALSLSREAIHSWRFEKNGPSDIEVIKSMAEFLNISDYRILLIKKIGEQNMTANDRILDSLKRIYDAVILYLDYFDTSFAYLTDFYDFKEAGLSDDEARNEIYGVASDSLHEVEIVLQQEYIILHKLDIYSNLESFISRDLCDIWDLKLNYEDKRDQITDDNDGMYCHERYEVVYNRLNEIMSEYF
ncbi:MAG: hypothetical protein J5517_07450 [Eubacterium sp.]|nr:hypothetical protein [Eubacterium sp.]